MPLPIAFIFVPIMFNAPAQKTFLKFPLKYIGVRALGCLVMLWIPRSTTVALLCDGGGERIPQELNHPRSLLYSNRTGKYPIIKVGYLCPSQTRIGKCLWFTSVCFGFLGAGFLISNSYFEWQKSPVASSISTISISDLEFPNVTICPPKGSNTALNYDIMNAENNLMTEEQKEKLSQDAFSVFVDAPFQEHVNRMLLN